MSLMDGLDPINRFELNDDCVFDQEIDAISTLHAYAFVHYRQCLLALGVQASTRQLVHQTGFVG